MDMKYLQNRQICGTSYTNKDKRGRSSKSSNRFSKPLTVLSKISNGRKSNGHKSGSRNKRSNKYGEYEKANRHRERDRERENISYNDNTGFKEARKNLKNAECRQSHRNKRNHNKSKENYYQALENMLSVAQNQNNLNEKQIEYARRYAEQKISQGNP